MPEQRSGSAGGRRPVRLAAEEQAAASTPDEPSVAPAVAVHNVVSPMNNLNNLHTAQAAEIGANPIASCSCQQQESNSDLPPNSPRSTAAGDIAGCRSALKNTVARRSRPC